MMQLCFIREHKVSCTRYAYSTLVEIRLEEFLCDGKEDICFVWLLKAILRSAATDRLAKIFWFRKI